MSRPSIAILLSTYNGAQYLREQLDSLWAQTTQDFVVYVRDDGSTDGTPQLLAQEARARPGRLIIVEGGGSRLGPMASFGRLLEQCHADYFAFCDQDDVWQKDKLERFVDAVRKQEALDGAGMPILCCSDVTVTDARLRVLSPASYYATHTIRPSAEGMPLARLMFRNFVIGASSMVNRALRDAALPLPASAIMHDWWMALVATCLGRVVVLPGSSMLYRQHSNNAIGSRRRNLPTSVAQAQAHWSWSTEISARCIRQALAFHHRYGASLRPADQRLLQSFEAFAARGPMGRLAVMLRARAFKPSLMLNTVHLLACISAKV